MESLNIDKLSAQEKRELISLISRINTLTDNRFSPKEVRTFRKLMLAGMHSSSAAHDSKGLPIAILALKTAILFAEAIEPDHNILLSIGLYPLLTENLIDLDTISSQWGEDVAGLLKGLIAVDRFSNKNNVVNQDNFRGLMLSLADDIRVIIIMIVRNLVLMRSINHHP
ncbi:MAG: HD domain-containing protein, partial [Muribaculaceae bacterium]|nr:HD domain-containing protein [Muribaculaceae bacterium]